MQKNIGTNAKKKYRHTNILSSFINNNQDMETT